MISSFNSEGSYSDNISVDDNLIPKDWIAIPFRRWCKLAGISCSHGYAEAAAGLLKITKSGNKSLITRDESDRYFSARSNEAA